MSETLPLNAQRVVSFRRAATVLRRGDAELTQEHAPQVLLLRVAGRLGDALQRLVGFFECTAGCLNAPGLHHLCRRAPEAIGVNPRERAWRHAHLLGQGFDPKVVAQVTGNPGMQVVKSTATAGL